jgi:uncharacterized membrane protein
MAVNGSLSKTAGNGSAGARTQVSGLVMALTVVTLLVLTGLFESLPEATLAAVVICAVIELVDFPALAKLYRDTSRELGRAFGVAARPDFIAAVAAMLGVLVFDTLPGLFIGISMSLLLLLYRASRPGGIAPLRGEGGLYFANADAVRARGSPPRRTACTRWCWTPRRSRSSTSPPRACSTGSPATCAGAACGASPLPGDAGPPCRVAAWAAPRQGEPMSNLVAVAFPDQGTAEEVMGTLARLQTEHAIELEDAVIVTRGQDGKVKLHQSRKLASGGAVGGALWGGLIGLIFFVPLLGMAVGAASGAAAGALSDVGVDDSFLKELGTKLQPGGAAVIVLVHRSTPDKVLPEIARFGGEIIQTSLDDEAEQRLRHALETREATAV